LSTGRPAQTQACVKEARFATVEQFPREFSHLEVEGRRREGKRGWRARMRGHFSNPSGYADFRRKFERPSLQGKAGQGCRVFRYSAVVDSLPQKHDA